MANRTTHTPGPFWFAKAEDSARFDYAVGAGNSEIAHVDKRADAALFRAAPDMLAALRLAESICDEGCLTPAIVGAREALDAVRDAIRKAEARK